MSTETDSENPEMKTLLGKIHSKGSMFLRKQIATAKDNSGNDFEICIQLPNSLPLIRCVQTGLYFILDWQDILLLAAAAGITHIPAESNSLQPKPLTAS